MMAPRGARDDIIDAEQRELFASMSSSSPSRKRVRAKEGHKRLHLHPVGGLHSPVASPEQWHRGLATRRPRGVLESSRLGRFHIAR